MAAGNDELRVLADFSCRQRTQYRALNVSRAAAAHRHRCRQSLRVICFAAGLMDALRERCPRSVRGVAGPLMNASGIDAWEDNGQPVGHGPVRGHSAPAATVAPARRVCCSVGATRHRRHSSVSMRLISTRCRVPPARRRRADHPLCQPDGLGLAHASRAQDPGAWICC